jgi:thioredoxin 1
MLNRTEKMNTNEGSEPAMQLDEASFAAAVLQSKEPVLVAFLAPWSPACRVVHPVLQEVARALEGKAKVVKVNADDSLDLSLWYDIQSIPTLLCFVEGAPRLRIVGTATKEALLARLEPFCVTSETVALANVTSGAGHKPGKEK